MYSPTSPAYNVQQAQYAPLSPAYSPSDYAAEAAAGAASGAGPAQGGYALTFLPYSPTREDNPNNYSPTRPDCPEDGAPYDPNSPSYEQDDNEAEDEDAMVVDGGGPEGDATECLRPEDEDEETVQLQQSQEVGQC